jgi:hypothetical protein
MGCDPEHRKKCEWYLVPDTDKISEADPGYIRVCARNYVVNKQDCRLQTTLDFAVKVEKKKFRYTDLKIKSFAMPRKIDQIELCE